MLFCKALIKCDVLLDLFDFIGIINKILMRKSIFYSLIFLKKEEKRSVFSENSPKISSNFHFSLILVIFRQPYTAIEQLLLAKNCRLNIYIVKINNIKFYSNGR